METTSASTSPGKIRLKARSSTNGPLTISEKALMSRIITFSVILGYLAKDQEG
ncbi:hypothetical protein GGR74_002488 [Xanthomonas arboricola]